MDVNLNSYGLQLLISTCNLTAGLSVNGGRRTKPIYDNFCARRIYSRHKAVYHDIIEMASCSVRTGGVYKASDLQRKSCLCNSTAPVEDTSKSHLFRIVAHAIFFISSLDNNP